MSSVIRAESNLNYDSNISASLSAFGCEVHILWLVSLKT